MIVIQLLESIEHIREKELFLIMVLLLSMDMLVIGQINSWPAKEDTLREEASIYLKSLLLKSLLMKPWKNQAGVNFINQKYLMVKRIAKPLTRTRSLCPPIVCNVDWRPTTLPICNSCKPIHTAHCKKEHTKEPRHLEEEKNVFKPISKMRQSRDIRIRKRKDTEQIPAQTTQQLGYKWLLKLALPMLIHWELAVSNSLSTDVGVFSLLHNR
ncbi:hypothetical protein T4B_12039 [Trichinella pseudospiralis]|uniref:Uncharacterized protein n=1 Tax=Trichinella pseudospiralis TaxID=6337 RepID=A0A0V1HTH3_TRIPS|nr:hypothetical protein T4B_12039 [Trichinella pseudospiralis]